MNKIVFTLAQEDELDEIHSMFRAAIAEMERHGIHQWDDIYPDRNILRKDIIVRQLFVGKIHGEIVCAYVLNTDCDAEYQLGNWKYPREYSRIVHRLCVKYDYQNCGIGRKTMLHIEKQAKKLGAQSIRLDAFTLNPYSLRLYEHLGYNRVGLATWRNGDFYLMEKLI